MSNPQRVVQRPSRGAWRLRVPARTKLRAAGETAVTKSPARPAARVRFAADSALIGPLQSQIIAAFFLAESPDLANGLSGPFHFACLRFSASLHQPAALTNPKLVLTLRRGFVAGQLPKTLVGEGVRRLFTSTSFCGVVWSSSPGTKLLVSDVICLLSKMTVVKAR